MQLPSGAHLVTNANGVFGASIAIEDIMNLFRLYSEQWLADADKKYFITPRSYSRVLSLPMQSAPQRSRQSWYLLNEIVTFPAKLCDLPTSVER
jgi:hypothetical protein